MRSFEIFARANGIEGQQKLKDSLLAKGGGQLQEIYFLLPGSIKEPQTSSNARPYDDCVKLLQAYFKPHTSKTYEKYRLNKQTKKIFKVF